MLAQDSVGKKEYSRDGEGIVVHDRESLVRTLMKERDAEVLLDSEVSRKIWQMGHGGREGAS